MGGFGGVVMVVVVSCGGSHVFSDRFVYVSACHCRHFAQTVSSVATRRRRRHVCVLCAHDYARICSEWNDMVVVSGVCVCIL